VFHRIHALPVPRPSIAPYWIFHASAKGGARLGLAREELGWNTLVICHHYLAVELGYRQRDYARSRQRRCWALVLYCVSQSYYKNCLCGDRSAW
jgi:hypothetical protein